MYLISFFSQYTIQGVVIYSVGWLVGFFGFNGHSFNDGTGVEFNFLPMRQNLFSF